MSASLCTAFRVLSKPSNLQEIQKQETPDEHVVKSWPCEGSVLQKTINKRCLLHRSVLDLQDRIVHDGTSPLRKEKLLRANLSINVRVCIKQIGSYYISVLLASTDLN